TREEAGTPNVIGDIRAALVFIVKDVIGQDSIAKREVALNDIAKLGWSDNSALTLLGVAHDHRLPIFSFLVTDANGELVHHKDFTRALSDVYGIQTRGGCACAGPYGHSLLEVDRQTSEALRDQVLSGNDLAKPGWVRLNFSYLMSDETAAYIIASVGELASQWAVFNASETAA
ncbi:MAG: selenocysteine lyase/cysteine desulfurase, partial [Paracoccaceae bacterium]